jgi:oleandomycin transport system ATP-binding protein
MNDAAIETDALVKTFGEVRAVDGVDMVASEGTVFGLLGPNGAGKTTAIRVLSTLLKPDSGRAIVGGYDVVGQPNEVRASIGLTGQYAAVDELLSGTENLYMLGRLIGMSRTAARRRATELLGSFDLSDAGGRLVKTYSGGMRRRLDLASSLVGRPRFLYLDEPTTGLDPRSRTELWGLIRNLVAEGTTVLLTTQYLEEADRLADELVVIDHGKVIAAGTPSELKGKVGAQVVAVRPTESKDVPRALEILTAFSEEGSTHADGEFVLGAISDPSQLGTIARRFDDEAIQLDELSLRRASLDEVFLALTGHVAEEDTPADEQDDSGRSR